VADDGRQSAIAGCHCSSAGYSFAGGIRAMNCNHRDVRWRRAHKEASEYSWKAKTSLVRQVNFLSHTSRCLDA